MNLFSKMKFNDYNLMLEKVLDTKYFSSNIKSLLLSMIYKIENSYEDYKIVKHINKSKDNLLNEIIEIIKEYCDNIKIIEPSSKDAEIIKNNNVFAITNTKERSILAYPTEISLLYSIIDILPKYFYVEDSFLFKNAMQIVLVNGVNQNTIEILSDFNGWSWDINLEYKNDIASNLIYQNFILIFDQEYMDNWMMQNNSKKSSILELKNNLKNTNYFSYLCKYLYTISNKTDKKKIEEKYEFKKETKLNILVKLQLEFTKYMLEIANNVEEKEDILRLLYGLRYYRELYIDNNVKIKDITKIEDNLNEVYKVIITKACKKEVLKIVNMDINMNYQITKQVLDTKIINLDEIKIKLKLDTNKIIVDVYENDVLEKEIYIEGTIKKDDIIIKLNKKYKLFN